MTKKHGKGKTAARLNGDRIGKHAAVKAKMDAGDGRTVVADVAAAAVSEHLASGVTDVEDAEGFTLETADGKYRLKPDDVETSKAAPDDTAAEPASEAEDAEPVR